MTSEELNTALYQKMFAEQEQYKAWLLTQPPEEILNHTYEYTVREDILITLENNDVYDEQAEALLQLEAPLAEVFKEFQSRETDYMDVVLDSLETCADAEIAKEQERREEVRNTPVYLYPQEYATENGELEQYLQSRKLSIACRDAIEQAIAQHYADNCLDTATAVRQVADVFGYDRMLHVLAITVQHKERDGRISRSNKDWAMSVPVFADRIGGSADQNVFLVVRQAHPGLIDLFVRGARRAQAQEKEKEQKQAETAKAIPTEKPSILERLKRPVQKNSPNISANKTEPVL